MEDLLRKVRISDHCHFFFFGGDYCVCLCVPPAAFSPPKLPPIVERLVEPLSLSLLSGKIAPFHFCSFVKNNSFVLSVGLQANLARFRFRLVPFESPPVSLPPLFCFAYINSSVCQVQRSTRDSRIAIPLPLPLPQPLPQPVVARCK